MMQRDQASADGRQQDAQDRPDIRPATSAATTGTNLDNQQSDRNIPPPVITNDEADLGGALRNIYEQTVNEDIPAEMLDLLKRLD